jgi:hypothetical protein
METAPIIREQVAHLSLVTAKFPIVMLLQAACCQRETRQDGFPQLLRSSSPLAVGKEESHG